jgi:alpha-methylacyl-CoA racemase
LAVGCLEPKFYAQFLSGLELDPASLPAQYDKTRWPELRETFTRVIAQRTREQWQERFEGTDACVSAVLTFREAREHPHLRQRGTFLEVDPQQAAPAPRFSRTPGQAVPRADKPHGDAAVQAWGIGVHSDSATSAASPSTTTD